MLGLRADVKGDFNAVNLCRFWYEKLEDGLGGEKILCMSVFCYNELALYRALIDKCDC